MFGSVAVLTMLAFMAGVSLAGGGYKAKKADIVDTAVAAGNFQTLVTALKAAGLVETLKGDGPFTVFAPTDEAFAKLPEGTIEALLRRPRPCAGQGCGEDRLGGDGQRQVGKSQHLQRREDQ
jgi:hypothetical protein